MASTKKAIHKVEIKPIVERKRRKSDLVIMWQSFWDVTASIGLELWLMVLRLWEMTKLWFSSSERQQLQTWLARYLSYVPDDFSDSWRDGRLLCTLLNKLHPGSFSDVNNLDPDYGLRNVYRAFDVLEANFGITPIILPEEIVTCTPGSDQKLCEILLQLKEMTTYKPETQENASCEANEETLQQSQIPENCIAKGTGLAVGFVGKMTNFMIFCTSFPELDIVIEIKGPSNTICSERITKRSPRRRLSELSWDSSRKYPITRSVSYNGNMNSSSELTNPVEDSEKEERVSIPLEYEVQDKQVFIGYKPICKGQHRITILWHGLHVSDSPYTVTVEDPAEMAGTSNKPHLKSALKSTNYEEKQSFKSPSVRFKDNSEEKKQLGKVLRKKVLRYIVKIGGQDVTVETDNTESLATELLKMDYEFDKCPTFYRRNSWGFAGEAERKRSVIRQFHVDVSQMEAQCSQRRSHSLSLNPSSKKSLRKSESIEDLTSQTRLRTVAEGSARDFNRHEFMDGENEEDFAYITEDVDSVFEQTDVDELPANEKEGMHNYTVDPQTTYKEPQSVDESKLIDESFQTKALVRNVDFQACPSKEDISISSLFAATIKAKAENLNDDRQKIHSANPSSQCNIGENVTKEKENDDSCISNHGTPDNEATTSTEKPKRNKNGSKDAKCERCLSVVPKLYELRKITRKTKSLSTRKRKASNKRFNSNDMKQIKSGDGIHDSSISANFPTDSLKTALKKEKANLKNKKCDALSRINNKRISKFNKLRKLPNLREQKNSSENKPKSNSDYSRTKHNKMEENIHSFHFDNSLNNSVSASKCIGVCNGNLNLPNAWLSPTLESYATDYGGKAVGSNYWPPNAYHSTFSEQAVPKPNDLYNAEYQLSSKNYSSISLQASNIQDFQQNTSPTSTANSAPTSTFSNSTAIVNSFKSAPLKTHMLLPIRQYNFKQFNPPSENFATTFSVKNRILEWERVLSSGKRDVPSKKHPQFYTDIMNVRTKLRFWENVVKSSESSGFESTTLPRDEEQVTNIILNSHDNGSKSVGLSLASTNHHSTGEKSFSEDVPAAAGKEKGNSINKDEKIPSKKHANDKLSADLSKSHVVQRRSFSDPGVTETTKENYEDCFYHPITQLSKEENMDSSYDVNFLDSSSDDDLSIGNLQPSTEDEYIDDEIPESASDFWGDLTLLKSLKNSTVIGYKNEGYHSDSDIFKNRLQSAKAYPSECKVFGIAIYYGYVAVKNKFQVLTKGSGCGNLSVSIQGFGRHDVSFVSVVYTQKDIYEVTYQVMTPGHYLISVRWMGSPVPGSPFTCKVTF